MLLYVWMVWLFAVGACVGSMLNVFVYRLPYEKSVLWPLRSYCSHCLQPIRWYDNIPLVSYWILRGRCRVCRTRFSPRYFVVELLTALSFVGLFYLDVVLNVHRLEILEERRLYVDFGIVPLAGWLLFAFHAVLFCFLLVASLIDLDHLEIPLPVTITGSVVGLAIGALLWPLLPAGVQPVNLPGGTVVLPGEGFKLEAGLYPWPVWHPLPDWLPPASWRTGLATGLAGFLAGMLSLRAVRFVFGLGRGKEGLGLGDADLMMMAGCFIGWQPVLVSFLVGVFVGLFFGIGQLILRGDQELPFGPSLALGTLITLFAWRWIGPPLQSRFFDPVLLGLLGGTGFVFLFLISLLLRVGRGSA